MFFIFFIIIFLLINKNDRDEEIIKKRLKEKIKKATKKLEYQAHYDALTGLPNRVLFNDRLEHAIEKAERNKNKISLFFIDLDHFKEINDSLGHDIGDKLLISVSERLSFTG